VLYAGLNDSLIADREINGAIAGITVNSILRNT